MSLYVRFVVLLGIGLSLILTTSTGQDSPCKYAVQVTGERT